MEDRERKRDSSSRTRPTKAIVEAVAAAEDVPPEEVVPPTYEPLHDVVDPQALDALFAPKRNGTPRVGGRVSFEFCGYEVTVHEDGSITLD